MNCIINTSPDGPPLHAADRAAILDALRGITSGPRFVELRIESQLDEGFSTARVFEGCLVPADGGEERRVVVKVDTQARLQQELKAAAMCGREKNVAPIMAPLELVRRGPQDRGAIIYEHASEPWPGELRSLRAVVRAALGEPGARENALNLIARTLGCLDRQVHAKARVELTPSLQLDFYLTRWLPGARLRVDDVDTITRRLHLCVGRGAADPLPLEFGRKDVLSAPDGSSRPIHEGLGERVSILISELRVADGSIVARIPGEGAVHVDANPPVVAAVAAWIADEGLAADAALPHVHLCGELTATRHSGYAQLLAAVGLDPASERWELAGMTVKNPLPGLQETAWSWCSRGPRSEFVFGHGDLHGGNALCVGQDVAIIDLGLAGERQPRWADAARLIGSLWRDSIAPQLGTDELVRALVAAFRSETAPALAATDRAEAAAALLRGAFDRAIAAPKSADRVSARRELWIDLHHFCWVALKWSLGDRLGEDAAQRRVLAMALLAAIAAESVDRERQAILRHRDTDVLKDTRAVGATLHERFEREGDAHGLLTYRAEARSNLLRLEGLALAKPKLRTAYLSAHLERAILMPEWGDVEVAEINDLRARVEDSLDPPEEAMLADALLFGCSRQWNDRAFLALLDLCESGEERVAIEAYLALGLLLERPATQHALARHDRLRKRLSRTLSRPEAMIVLAEIGRALSEPLPVFDEKILQSPTLSGSRPRELAWMLRPYRAADHGPSAVDSERSTLLVGLEDSRSLSDMEKHTIAAGEASLSSFQRSELIKIFTEERQKFAQLGGSRLHYCLWTRLASLRQIGGLAHFALPSLDLAARRIARTLTDVLEDERAVGKFTRLVLVRQLFAKHGRTLLMLEALCRLPEEAAVTEREALLVLAIDGGACEAFLGLLPLLAVNAASPGPVDHVRAHAAELLHTLGAELTSGSESDDGMSTKVQAIAQKWAVGPQAREVFSPSVFEWFVTHLVMTTEGFDASELGSFALFMEQRGMNEEAERLYRQAMDAEPRNAHILGNFADFMEKARGENEEAERLYRQAVDADPRHARHLGNFARFMEQRGEHEEAERLYRQAVNAVPRNANILGNFALFMKRRGKPEEAERLYRRAMDADPRNARHLGNFALFMEQRGMNEEAEHLYRQAVDAEPRNTHVLGNFADFMEKARRANEEAERLYRQALDADPRNARHLGNFARFMTRRGNHEEAERLYRKALDVDPRNANNLGNFAGALFAWGRTEEAAEMVVRSRDGVGIEDALLLELHFYEYAHIAGTREAAATEIEAALTRGVRSSGFDLSRNVERALADVHPDPARLQSFAAAISAEE